MREPFERAHAARCPTDARGIVKGAETIRLPHTTGRAALLLHGFNDTPQSMTYLANAMHAAGWSVLVPRLPGHGVRLDLMVRESRASLWRAAVEESYAALRETHESVVVCGQSMGGALAVLLSRAHAEISALVLLAPYLGMPRKLQLQLALVRLFQSRTSYRYGRGGERSLHDPDARRHALGPGVITVSTMHALREIAEDAQAELPNVRVPVLYLQSREDNRISIADAERHFAAIGGDQKVQRWLTGCGHIISNDFQRADVAAQTIDWFNQHLRAPATP
jgi:carboxylesterase